MKFIAFTALASALTFGGVWFASDPGPPAAASTIVPASTPESVVASTTAASPPASPIAGPQPQPQPQPPHPQPQPAESAEATSVYYAGCDEVRALGKDPLYRQDPGYREGMDGDGDGIACEPIR